jgi:hypothetical protein
MGRIHPFLVLLAALLSTGCGDDPLPAAAPSPGVTTLQGRILRVDGDPAAALSLGLFRLDDLRYVGIDTTAADGTFRFTALAPGRYTPVMVSRGVALVNPPPLGLEIAAEETLRVELRASLRAADEPVLTGTVVDAESGEPVAGAVVEVGTLTIEPPELDGRLAAARGVTDAAGRFALEDFFFFADVLDPGNARSADLLCHAPGYRGLRRRGFTPAETPVRNLRLALAPGADEAVLTGHLIDLGLGPAVGVPVGLEWVSRPEFLLEKHSDALVMQQKTAVTDSSGFFRLEGVPSGVYHLLVGARRDDGWLRVVPEGLPPEAPPLVRPTVSVAAGESLHVEGIPAVEAVRPLQPARGAAVSSQPDFAWEEWPWRGTEWAAGWYLVLALQETTDPERWLWYGPLEAPSLVWPDPDFRLPRGRHRWQVVAAAGWAEGLRLFETWSTFSVEASVAGADGVPIGAGFRCNPPDAPRVLPADGS